MRDFYENEFVCIPTHNQMHMRGTTSILRTSAWAFDRSFVVNKQLVTLWPFSPAKIITPAKVLAWKERESAWGLFFFCMQEWGSFLFSSFSARNFFLSLRVGSFLFLHASTSKKIQCTSFCLCFDVRMYKIMILYVLFYVGLLHQWLQLLQ